MEQITWQGLMGAAAIMIALIAAYNTVASALKNRKDIMKDSPLTKAVERIDKHDAMLAADKRRIENLEEMTRAIKDHDDKVDEGLMVLMRSTLAMSRHMQHGNNINGLRDSENEITNYLTNK